ncbi:MAG: dihydrolipoyl dehydrogenase [Candidatus Latescibacterota bacterium]|nr:dihydrolipoyl dehydrogenase [Candidatus Latescibacterota bacterium]MEE3042018.1 dihydrolipoyl dehydrogenase [Candidatus Latescibacterota bacterium]
MSVASSEPYDLVVIGGGPGGYSGAIRAAQHGWRVAVVEAADRLGGVCLNWGCIPTKTLLHQAHLLQSLREAEDFGLSVRGEIGFDWRRVIERSREVTDGLAAGVAGLMRRHKIDVIHGHGRLTSSGDVSVETEQGDQRLVANRVLLATGGRPLTLPGVDLADHPRILTSREAMVLGERPRSIAIIGAGAIGIEFARFFAAFGTKVTLLEGAPKILPTEDDEIVTVVEDRLAADGVEIHTGVQVETIEGGPRRRTTSVVWRDGDDGERASARTDLALIAIGVTGNIEDAGLETLGIATEGGSVVVDSAYRTSCEKVWAIGDVIGGACLAHVATAEAVAAVGFMTDRRKAALLPGAIPSCVYGDPEVARVGLSEAEARAQGIEIRIGRFPFAASGRALATGTSAGFIKLIFGARYGDLLGACLVGPGVTELIGELGLAIQMEATWEELAHTVHAHPTLSEGIMEAAAAAFDEAINI